jgi:hypothetical protein
MKKIAILLSLIVSVPLIAQGQKHKTYFKDFLVTANAGQLVGVNDVSEDGVIDAIDDTCKITYNIHESLPSDWVTEFYVIMDTLSMIIPLYQTYYEKVAIYAWNNIIEDPYPGVDGGQYISMKDGNPMMVLEISNNEFVHNSMHRYSVIAHEYFHLYQKSITKGMNATHANQYEPFGVKWLIEGTAASFESLYIRQNYNINYFGAQANLNSELLTDPSVFEIYVNNEVNYGSSVFLVLVLVKELIKSGYSEEAAFRLIYIEYLLLNPNIQNWKTVFDSVFPFSLEDFYNTVKTYDLDLNLVLPSETLKIEDIFVLKYVADTTSPLAVFNPANESVGVAVASNITITFSEAVRKTDYTVLENNNVDAIVTLKNRDANGTDIAFDATVNDAKTVITVDPSSNFLSEQTIYVAIGTGVLEDYVGNDLEPISVTFTTEDIIPPSPFDLVYPLDSTTVILTRDNFLDTLYFAWNQSVDTGGDAVTYTRGMTGDLPEYIRFIVPGDGRHETEEAKGYSLSFDGTDDYVSGSASDSLDASISNRLTISAWVNPAEGMGGSQRLFTYSGSNSVSAQYALLLSNGKLYFLAGNGGFEEGGGNMGVSPLSENQWSHVCMTYDGTAVRLYINGTLDFEHYVTDSFIQDNIGEFYIGMRSDGVEVFKGLLDEIAIWNSALNANAVVAIYNSGSGLDASSNSGDYTSASNLKGYWRFDENTGTTAGDLSGNNNNGTIYGATWNTDSPIMRFKHKVGNMFKVPYHHIEHYMHEAGVELITGTWTIIATDGKYDVSATNGPFTLTIDGSKLNVNESDLVPETFALHANYPNPFNPTTTISYDLPKRSQVTLGIYDLLGKQIKTLVNQSQDAGNKIAMWDGTDDLGRPVSAGVYLYQIQAGEFTQTRKMLLLK